MDKEMMDALLIAEQEAGKPDDGWNRRFFNALEGRGYTLAKDLPSPDFPTMMAPKPVLKGWAYIYPSVIVKKTS